MRSQLVNLGILSLVAIVFGTACQQSTSERPKVTRPSTAVTPTPAESMPAQGMAEETKPASPVEPAVAPPAAQALAAVLEDERPAELYEPKVALSAAHEKATLVKVGDSFSQLVLPNLEGKEIPLASLLGGKLTVVVFWSSEWLFARELFQRLGPEISARYAHLGLKAVAVNVGEKPLVVKQFAQESGAQFPCLVDPEKKAFSQIAESGLPRIYLLNAQGQVVWLDLEYSSVTRRELHNAVHFFANEEPANKVN